MEYLPFRVVKADILCGYDKQRYEGVYKGDPITVTFNTHRDHVTYEVFLYEEDDGLRIVTDVTMTIDEFLKATRHDIVNKIESALF